MELKKELEKESVRGMVLMAGGWRSGVSSKTSKLDLQEIEQRLRRPPPMPHFLRH